jgi:hypothetical protein
MKQKLFIFGTIIVLAVILIGLNAATYVQKEKAPDTELQPNRSTFNAGATGTQAFYSLLSETGRNVTRWQRPVDELAGAGKNKPATFVMIGTLRRGIDANEATRLLEWVSSGGRLVIIDREPLKDLVVTTANWKITLSPKNGADPYNVDPSDHKQMTADTAAEKPVQPTAYTRGVNAVQPSRFASSVFFERYSQEERYSMEGTGAVSQGTYELFNAPPPPPPKPANSDQVTYGMGTADPHDEEYEEYEEEEADPVGVFDAPIVHVGGTDRNLLIDAPFGQGRIIFLADPFIVSNIGIGMVDNAQLAMNVVESGGGLIAFDEYHQGYGSNENRLLQYFEGTPVTAILLQCVALIGLVLFTQSRRFARALPEAELDRLSKLEYVSAMAELQRRTHAYDLAIENIYSDFRRRVTRLFGVDNKTTKHRELASLIAERVKLNANDVEQVLFRCEDIIRGEPAGRKTTVELVEQLRSIEDSLGLKRSAKGKM